MKAHLRKATIKDALYVAANLRDEDLAEVEGLGHNRGALPFSVAVSDVAVSMIDSTGELVGVAGISPNQQDRVGSIWLLCTPGLERSPQTFIRMAKRWLKEQEKDYDVLWNLTGYNNKFHHKFLKIMGFKALRIVQPAPTYLPYYEIVKLCV